MKNLIITIAVFFSMLSYNFAQSSAELLKVSYVANGASDFVVNTIKKQVKDDNELSHVLYLITESKVYYSLYADSKSNSSLFALDSTDIVQGVSTSGHFNEVVKDNQKTYGNELFMDSEIVFSGNVDDLEWEFTNEQKEILGYNCRKATLSNAPGYYAWFSQEIPISDGPGIYKGLPGLVLEVNTPFEYITVSALETISDNADAHDNQTIENNSEDATSLMAMLTKKDNFRRMIVAGK